MDAKTKRLVTGIAGLTLLSSCCGCCVLAWFKGTEMQEAIGAAGAACAGQAVVEAAAYQPGGRNRFAFFEPGREGWDWVQYLGETVEPAETTEQASVVLCLGEERANEVERCAYEGGQMVRRTQHTRALRVVEARTGRVLAEGDVPGSVPENCPQVFSSGGGGVGIRIARIPIGSVGGESATAEENEGSVPDLDDIGRWAAAALDPNREPPTPVATPSGGGSARVLTLPEAVMPLTEGGQVLPRDPGVNTLTVRYPGGQFDSIRQHVQQWMAQNGWTAVAGSQTDSAAVARTLAELGQTQAAELAAATPTFGESYQQGGSTVAVNLTGSDGAVVLSLNWF